MASKVWAILSEMWSFGWECPVSVCGVKVWGFRTVYNIFRANYLRIISSKSPVTAKPNSSRYFAGERTDAGLFQCSPYREHNQCQQYPIYGVDFPL